jgi:hypothetical protein
MKPQIFALPVLALLAISALWVVAQENAQPRPRDTVADAQDQKNAPEHSQPGPDAQAGTGQDGTRPFGLIPGAEREALISCLQGPGEESSTIQTQCIRSSGANPESRLGARARTSGTSKRETVLHQCRLGV